LYNRYAKNQITIDNINRYGIPKLRDPSALPINANLKPSIMWKNGLKNVIFCMNSGSLSTEKKVPLKKESGTITKFVTVAI
tara:strand:- start:1 stop:243 length:243 start_codon:yes stop_codon:yes gene_type:complete